jgi:hypothetical protein
MFCLLLSTYRSSLNTFQTEHKCLVCRELKEERYVDKRRQYRNLGSSTALCVICALCIVFLFVFYYVVYLLSSLLLFGLPDCFVVVSFLAVLRRPRSPVARRRALHYWL